MTSRMIVQIIGGLFATAGALATCAGLATRIDPTIVGAPWEALFGGGLVGVLVGFLIACAGRGEASRASVAFCIHVGAMEAVVAAFYVSKERPSLLPIFAAALAAQLAIGLLLLFTVMFAGRRPVGVFIPSILVYLATLGGFIFAVV